MARLSKLSPRKQILLRCACYRRIGEMLGNDESREFLKLVEQYSEGNATRRQVKSARSEAVYNAQFLPPNSVEHAVAVCAIHFLTDEKLEPLFGNFQTTIDLSDSVASALELSIKRDRQFEKNLHQEYLEDIETPKGQLIDPRWQTSTVLDLARTIYDERAFERMPILSDALMDAGCDNEDIINHCQGPGPHVRGCWVVDLILSKDR